MKRLSPSAVSSNTDEANQLINNNNIVLKGKLQYGTTSKQINDRRRSIKDSADMLKSHTTVIADTAMINNHYGGSSQPKVLSGLISQLNSSAEQLQ